MLLENHKQFGEQHESLFTQTFIHVNFKFASLNSYDSLSRSIENLVKPRNLRVYFSEGAHSLRARSNKNSERAAKGSRNPMPEAGAHPCCRSPGIRGQAPHFTPPASTKIDYTGPSARQREKEKGIDREGKIKKM